MKITVSNHGSSFPLKTTNEVAMTGDRQAAADPFPESFRSAEDVEYHGEGVSQFEHTCRLPTLRGKTRAVTGSHRRSCKTLVRSDQSKADK